MPLSNYFGGHGADVMANMKTQYGDKKGKSVFYATANKKGKGKGAPPSFKKKGKPKAKSQASALRRMK